MQYTATVKTHDRLERVYGKPALSCIFVAVLIYPWFVQDRDAKLAVRIDCDLRGGQSGQKSDDSIVSRGEVN
jgi:hypothetical protein